MSPTCGRIALSRAGSYAQNGSVAARRQTGAQGSLDDEVALLVVHGVLHLLNYDHAEEQETEAMRKRESELLDRFRDLEQEADR